MQRELLAVRQAAAVSYAAMKVAMSDAIGQGSVLGFACDEQGNVTVGFERDYWGPPYPPAGYLPWNRMEVGNGDNYGFYWPIGCEDLPPVVCTTMHDAWQMFPVAASLEACVKLHVAKDPDDEDWNELAGDLGINANGVAHAQIDRAESGYWGVRSAQALLRVDPNSPSLLLQRARELWVREENFDDAEETILRALEVLPEYTDAWWMLAQLRRRRQSQPAMVIDAMVNCLTSPMAFGGDADLSKCLEWLKRMDDSADPDATDPIWHRRHRLTLAEGVYEHEDYRVMEEAIEEYHEQGMGIRAVRLRTLYGERMGSETISFRERNKFKWDHYWADLRRDCERAGLDARLAAMSG